MNVQEFIAKDYSSNLVKSLFELWKEAAFCDVIIRVGNETFHAHKPVLASGSRYFKAMFQSGLSENTQNIITLHQVDPHIFSLLLNFFYTGKIDISTQSCQDLMTASDMFGISEVVNACCEFLKKHLQPDNCVGIYLFAKSFICEDLLTVTENFIHRNFLKICKEEEYFQLPKDALFHILNSNYLCVESEAQVFEAALNWLLYDSKSRQDFTFDIMTPVRFSLIPQQTVKKYIKECKNIHIELSLGLILPRLYKRTSLYASQTKSYLTQPRLPSKKNVYLIGGFLRLHGGRWSDGDTLSCVEKFDSIQRTWKMMPSLRHPRSSHGTAVLNGRIYVAGGERDSLIYDSVECFDPLINVWCFVSSMNFPRCGLSLCASNGYLFAVSGWVGSELGDSIEKYDPEADQWVYFDKVNTLRFSMGVAEHDGLIYVVGGMNDLGFELNTTENYNVVTKEWQSLCPMQTKRAHMSLAVLDGYIYAVGGWNKCEGTLSSVERYCPETNIWEYISPMTTPRAGPSVAAINGLLYVFAGRMSESSLNDQYTAPITLSSSEYIDTHVNTWTLGTQMLTSRCDAGLAVIL